MDNNKLWESVFGEAGEQITLGQTPAIAVKLFATEFST